MGEAVKPGLDWTLDWTGLWTGLRCGCSYPFAYGDREVMVLWLQVI